MGAAEQQVILTLAEWVVFLFLFLLGASVFVRLLTGSINTERLFWGIRSDGSRFFSPGRVQLFVFTIGAAIYYANSVTANWRSGVLPDVPRETLAILAGSHGVYLGGKAIAMLMSGGESERRP